MQVGAAIYISISAERIEYPVAVTVDAASSSNQCFWLGSPAL
jgi:hypothetical protein